MSSSNATATKPTQRSVWLPGLAATVGATIATTALAVLANRAGISFIDPAHPEMPIPPSGFATLTAVFSLVGVVLAAILARTARNPRSTFIKTTVALTALSIVPDFVAIPSLGLPDFHTATSFTLAGLHLVAAAIVIPVLAGRLAARR
jgi:hypothetical protein